MNTLTSQNLTKFMSLIQKQMLPTVIGNDLFWDTLNSNIQKFQDTNLNYPPYNINKLTECKYNIEFALAGFSKKDINISQEKNVLTIETVHINTAIEVSDNLEVTSIYKGIAKRTFKRSFIIAEYIKVINASMKNGILTITLERQKPKEDQKHTIKIL